MKMQFKSLVPRLSAGALVAAAALSNVAHAVIDTTAAETEIDSAVTAVGTIGLAVFGVVIAIKVWKWLRAST